MNTVRKDDQVMIAPTMDQFAALRKTIDTLASQAQMNPSAHRADGAKTVPPGRRSRAKGKTPMTTQQTAPRPGSNSKSFEAVLQEFEELGTFEAKGKDGQVKADLSAAEAAFMSSVDLTKDKHGPGIDDSVKMAERYVKGRNAAIIFDHKAPKQRKLASNIRTMVKLGGSTKYGVGQPMQNINDLVTIRQNLRKNPAKGQKLDDAHNMLMRYARAQGKRDTLITGDELKQFCFKAEHDPTTGEGVLRTVQKTLVRLRDGKLANCADVDNSAEVATMINAVNRRLTALAKAKGDAQQAA